MAFDNHGSLRALVVGACALWTACSSDGCGGALAPIPGGFTGAKTDNAVNLVLSKSGIDYVNANWPGLVDAFVPGRTLTVPLPCSRPELPVIGRVTFADQGNGNNGRLDDECDAFDQPAPVMATINGFAITPTAPDVLQLSVTMSVRTGKVYLRKGCVRCSFDFYSGREGAPNNELAVRAKLAIDTRWDKLLSVSIERLDGIAVCGTDGAAPRPRCMDPRDVDIDEECDGSLTCEVCSAVCTGADWEIVKTFLFEQLGPRLQSQIEATVKNQGCLPCGPGPAKACPSLGGAVSACGAGDVCVDTATQRCVPRPLGVEGRVALGALLGSFGAPADAALDTFVAAGSSLSIAQGASFGTRGGFSTPKVAACVPALPPPTLDMVPAPDVEGEAPANVPFHSAITMSQPFLGLALHHVHQSGGLCVAMTHESSAFLTTDSFKLFLPSLGALATRDGRGAPVRIELRPQRAPSVVVGAGTFDPATKKPIDPLLTLTLPELAIDLYVQLEERFVRLFTLTADISLPLSLVFEGCAKATPALGDLKQLITNVRTSSSELLTEEDLKALLKDFVPAIVALAEPAIAGAIAPFELPTLGGFKLKVNAAKGLTKLAGPGHQHLGLYAELVPKDAACALVAPSLAARVEALRPRSDSGEWPEVVLSTDVVSRGLEAAEVSIRLDDGLWGSFSEVPASGQVRFTHPGLLLQGRHTLWVRARDATRPGVMTAPVAVPVAVDFDPPDVQLRANRERGLLEVEARDNLSGARALVYAYAVGDETFGAFGQERPIDLAAVEAAGGVTIRVRDEAGNVGEGRYSVGRVDDSDGSLANGGGGLVPGPSGAAPVGCAAGGASLLVTPLVLLALSLSRRRETRRRSR